jgi:lysozyme
MPTAGKGKIHARNKKIILSILFLLLIMIISFLVYNWWQEKRSGFAHYSGFGIPMPSDYEIFGIDVSHHQAFIQWEAVKKMKDKGIRVGFAFIKATEGYTHHDRQFKRNWRKAREAGMLRGAYHFFLPGKSGSQQADHFMTTVRLEKGDMPPVLDVEETHGIPHPIIRKRVREWLEKVERHYGRKPIIYTGVDFYNRVLGSEFDDYPLWIAHYLKRDNPKIYRKWTFWQFSETGTVNGISSKVDFNVFHGDSAALKKLMSP